MPTTPLQQARQVSEELGSPGVEPLWIAVRRRGIKVTKEQVKQIVATRGEKQIFQPVQPSKGKSVAEDVDTRYQMDLADLRNQPAVRKDKTYKFFLVLVNVFTRKVFAKALKTKEPWEVAAKLSQLLKGVPKPLVMSSDNGAEFTGPVQEYLASKRITARFKAVGDVNALGVVDRSIQTLKRKLAEMMSASSSGSWVEFLPKAVAALNDTAKPGVLHGATPNEVRSDPQVRFMLLQDQAKNIEHNRKLTDKRVDKLQETNSFRVPLPESTSKFKRSFQATFGGVRRVQSIKGSTITDSEGQQIDIKRVRAVPINTSTAQQRFGSNEVIGPRKREQAGQIIVELERLLGEADNNKLSLTKAAAQLKQALKGESENYDQILRRAKAKLVDIIRLAPEKFELEQRSRGDRDYYWVKLKE